jgi:hypothetical protein
MINRIPRNIANFALPTDPLAHFKMNDTGPNQDEYILTDSSGNNYFMGMTDYIYLHTTTGKINTAIEFGNLICAVNNNVEITTGLTNFTVSAWVYSTVADTDQMIYTENVYVGPSTVLRITVDNKAEFGIATDDPSPQWAFATSTTTLATDTWHHLVGQKRGDDLNVYINGNLAGTTPFIGYFTGSPIYDCQIGAYFASEFLGGFFYGKIDDLRIYDKALTINEIKAIYNGGTGTED